MRNGVVQNDSGPCNRAREPGAVEVRSPVRHRVSAAFACVALALAGCSSTPGSALPPPLPAQASRPSPAATASTEFIPTPTIDVAQALVGTVQPATFASYPSPDGEWRVDVVIYACAIVDPETQQENSFEQLILVSAADSSRSVLDTQLLNCGGLGAAGFEGLFWTSDGEYFYYTSARDGVPDGCGYWEKPLGRFNVIERQAEAVGGGPISPDGSKLATWIDHSLTLWDLSGDRIGSVPQSLEDAVPGPIAWAPNGLSVAYLLSEDTCPRGTTYIVRMDLGTLNPVVVLSSISPSFTDIVWDVPNRILLTDEHSTTWSYNFDSGKLSPYSE
jgi:hypothetical protein